MLDYDYIKNYDSLIEFEFKRQSAIQQIEFTAPLKNPDGAIVSDESMFTLTILEKIKETRLKFSHGSVRVL